LTVLTEAGDVWIIKDRKAHQFEFDKPSTKVRLMKAGLTNMLFVTTENQFWQWLPIPIGYAKRMGSKIHMPTKDQIKNVSTHETGFVVVYHDRLEIFSDVTLKSDMLILEGYNNNYKPRDLMTLRVANVDQVAQTDRDIVFTINIFN
jgi:hypothetical protein